MAARWADEFNLSSSSPERTAERYARLDEALRAEARDPASLTHSAMVGVLIGRDDEELARREDALLRTLDIDPATGSEWFDERRSRWVAGRPEEARAMVDRFAAAGVERIMLQDFLPWDHGMIELLGRELIGRA